jgi:predicted lipoprotein with Yx(FWY)xxD motif
VDDITLLRTGLDSSRFALVTRRDGGRQLTYNGWPLYLYAGDHRSGAVGGNDGTSGTWHAALR